MHLLVRQTVSIDEADQAIDLGQTPGEIVVLSFTDSDLSALAAAWTPLKQDLPSLRLASLQRLRHPMSADLYIDDVVAHARFVIVRLLGGADYWRYGLDQITAVCRRNDIALAVVPGDGRADDRLAAASTVSASDLACIDAWLANGGNANLSSLLGFVASQLGRSVAWQEPRAVPAAGQYVPAASGAPPLGNPLAASLSEIEAEAPAPGGQTHGSDPMHSGSSPADEAGALLPTPSSRRRPGSTQVSESATRDGSRGAGATSSFAVESADAGVDPGLHRDDGREDADRVPYSERLARTAARQEAPAPGGQTHGSDPMHSGSSPADEAGALLPTPSSRRRPGSTQVSESATRDGSRGVEATSSFAVEPPDAGVDPGLYRDDGSEDADRVPYSERLARTAARQEAPAPGGQTHGSDPMHSGSSPADEAGALLPTPSSRRRPGSTQVSESATRDGSRGAGATSSFAVEPPDAGADPGLHRDDGREDADRVPNSERLARTAARQEAPAPGGQTHGSDPMHRALIIFYRSAYLAADTQPVDALMHALRERGLQPCAVFVTSLKDPTAAAIVGEAIAQHRPRVIINATAFSAQREDGSTVLDTANCPVLQVATAGLPHEAWSASERGLGAADLAMHVVLPEVDGRIFTRAVSFKAEAAATPELEFAPLVHRAVDDRIIYVADAARAWANLSATLRSDRRIAIVLSDYPGRGGRAGYALGLDTPASLRGIVTALTRAGYATGDLPTSDVDLMLALSTGASTVHVSSVEYVAALAAWPAVAREQVQAAWPPADTPAADADCQSGFGFRILQFGNLVIALQPDRGHASDRKAAYHDTALPPAPAYIAFYHWLRHSFRADAMVHLGTHGTLEWLPGKAVALSASCYPELVLGAMPVVYPYIVNDPGEAAQAKRRIAAVTIGHLSPPLATAGMHGAAAEIGALVDEYGTADGLDRRRSRLLREEILERARATGLAEECGISDVTDPDQALVRLDAWLCDLKELAIRDGLHIFGSSPNADVRARHMADLAGATAAGGLLASCGPSELAALVTALDGHRVAPGPSGALSRGRLDVLPTGRNLTTIDPRSIPTRTAAAIGARAAKEFLRQYQQDNGAWPQRVVLDVWASANMRTGGDDLAHAMQLMGVRPTWDHASARVSGFEVLPLAMLDGPRVDVTLRVSGLFRDVFPEQMRVFQQAVHAVAERDESDAQNPLAAVRRAGDDLDRIFSGAPGTYGTGVASRALDGTWDMRTDLADTYLQTGAWSIGADLEARANPEGFRARVGSADALLHTQDDNERDLLEGDGAADYLGGFAAAAESLGGDARLFHLDTSDPNAPKVRTLQAAVARIVRGRLTNPRWIAGQMRHGYRGAAELAQAVDALFAFAATTNAVRGDQFEAAFDAMLGTPHVLDFMRANNPAAAVALAQRFDDAIRRGFWQPRRNSVAAVLAEARGVTP